MCPLWVLPCRPGTTEGRYTNDDGLFADSHWNHEISILSCSATKLRPGRQGNPGYTIIKNSRNSIDSTEYHFISLYIVYSTIKNDLFSYLINKCGEICGLFKASTFAIFLTTVLIGIVKTTRHCCGRRSLENALQKHYWRANAFGHEKPSFYGTSDQKMIPSGDSL